LSMLLESINDITAASKMVLVAMSDEDVSDFKWTKVLKELRQVDQKLLIAASLISCLHHYSFLPLSQHIAISPTKSEGSWIFSWDVEEIISQLLIVK